MIWNHSNCNITMKTHLSFPCQRTFPPSYLPAIPASNLILIPVRYFLLSTISHLCNWMLLKASPQHFVCSSCTLEFTEGLVYALKQKIPCSTHSKATSHRLTSRLRAVLAPLTLEEECAHLESFASCSPILLPPSTAQEDPAAAAVSLLYLCRTRSQSFHSEQQVFPKNKTAFLQWLSNPHNNFPLWFLASPSKIKKKKREKKKRRRAEDKQRREASDRFYLIACGCSYQLFLSLCSAMQSVVCFCKLSLTVALWLSEEAILTECNFHKIIESIPSFKKQRLTQTWACWPKTCLLLHNAEILAPALGK